MNYGRVYRFYWLVPFKGFKSALTGIGVLKCKHFYP